MKNNEETIKKQLVKFFKLFKKNPTQLGLVKLQDGLIFGNDGSEEFETLQKEIKKFCQKHSKSLLDNLYSSVESVKTLTDLPNLFTIIRGGHFLENIEIDTTSLKSIIKSKTDLSWADMLGEMIQNLNHHTTDKETLFLYLSHINWAEDNGLMSAVNLEHRIIKRLGHLSILHQD